MVVKPSSLWRNPYLRAIVLAAILVLLALYAGEEFRFVYQTY